MCSFGNIGKDMPCKERLKHVKWSTLEQRRLFSPLIKCDKTINGLNGLDPSAHFTFAHDCGPLRANRHFKHKFASATLNSFKHFFLRRIDKWNKVPKEIAVAKNLNT